jgi:hypothetical protein
MKSEIEWVTDGFEPWRGLPQDIERSGARVAMIVTVEGGAFCESVYAAGR